MKAALIGAGQIAKQHLGCLRELPGVELAGVCDLSPAMAEAAAERFGVKAWFTDHRRMLAEVQPDVVHVTTPPHVHFALAREVIAAGAHVVVEKPVTETLAEAEVLLAEAGRAGKHVVENHNYVWNAATRAIREQVASGALGAVIHVEVLICLDIAGPGGGFSDPNLRHPALRLRGGAIADFLPHLSSLAYAFVGAHRKVHTAWSKRLVSPLQHDEFRALVEAERGTASLGLSSSAQPDAFWLRVYCEKGQAATNLFETRLTWDRVRGGPRPLRPTLNGLAEGKAIRRAAVRTLWRKFSGGPGTYDGLWELLARTYRALANGSELPVPAAQVLAVSRMVEALKPEAEGAKS
jgi:predicted dehydrogenase